jgi:excisionase family DNA binding protein
MQETIKLHTLQEVADICRVPLATVRYWRSMRRIRVIKLGKHPLVSHEDLLAFLEASRSPEIRP